MASQSVVSDQLQYQLRSFVLKNVLPSNKELGRGAYGKVFIVKYLGLSCTTKEIHALLLDGVRRNSGKESDQRSLFTGVPTFQCHLPS